MAARVCGKYWHCVTSKYEGLRPRALTSRTATVKPPNRGRFGDRPVVPCSSDSGRLTILKETARSQERLVLRATNTHQTMSRWLLFAKNCESSQTNRLYYLQFLIFVQLKFVLEKLKMQVTSASADFAMTNGDRSTELTESFLLVYRYLDFDNG